ncbi:MAG: pyridoxamine 5'-phosphate oxidase family protein [Dehalococcoidia bacterium]
MPRPERPDFDPSYGIPETPPERAHWPAVEEKLAASRNYWICTTRSDGRPHAKPVWAFWTDGALWFGSGAASVTGRNLARDPRVSAHLESGDDTVILEGAVEVVAAEHLAPALLEAYGAKYQMKPEDLADAPWFRFAPSLAFTWLEQDYPATATRWRFD